MSVESSSALVVFLGYVRAGAARGGDGEKVTEVTWLSQPRPPRHQETSGLALVETPRLR